ncbi:GntR family transcriptional regulator [Nocardia brasiliensis]|uniref:GntR family transcriptional regulator n=1 Tax=Nocardia brasiliensis (strain ATCC 700358 / HUJEG-1) TaxID=1133849 RepID=K0F132_NOCB7|nr:GntR family transcriptional regulator [Nocardia brasiliensis]AFU03377.1 GntR family transcriptional regulator [Nocardia brasiliensis ATCC 700358]OCF85233.1 GntR family transcriptional regulator [Nocardia brasiliensis]
MSEDAVDSKSEQIAAEIRDAIRQGRLERGVLYSSRELGERFGASRTPVREALLKLADLGLVKIERNRGARILGQDGRGIVDLCSLRVLLEPPACRSAAAVMTSRDDEAMLAEYRIMERTADGGAEYFAADERLHELILEASGNRRLAKFVAELRQTLALDGRHSVPRYQTVDTALKDHWDIIDALRKRDGVAAERAMRKHLVRSGDLLVAHSSADNRGLVGEWRRWVSVSVPEGDQVTY